MRATVETSFFVLVFFPLIYLLELTLPTFFVPFIEESLARLVPLLIVLYFHRNVHPFDIGLVAGATFGILEICVKTINLGHFSILMLAPMFLVHVPNAVAQSVVIHFSYDRRKYALIPVAFIICALYHWLYNAYLYVV